MAIEVLSNAVVKTQLSNVNNKYVAKNATSAIVSHSSDSVELTDDAKVLTKATEKAKASDGIDHEKVASLKSQIENGTYNINYQSIANKLLESEDEISKLFS